ncbi:MAG: type II toxin-antitoxin system HicA family toxin [Desulfovibrio sp.]|nr:type II toxin-antitoxin system HicA family toxin [Desulfovibrio sp.]
MFQREGIIKVKEIKKRLEAAGWMELPGGKTSHRHFTNPDRGVKVTVPCHPAT